MKTRTLASLLFFLVVTIGFTQVAIAQNKTDDQDGFKRKSTKTVQETTSPVTRSEAKKVFEKAWKSLSEGIGIKSAVPLKFASTTGTVTKDEVLENIRAIVLVCEKSFKRTPKWAKYDLKRFRSDLEVAKYKKLVDEGFVSPYGVLMTVKNGTVQPKQFGEAVGQMMIRVADLCHLPSRRFSPYLMPPG